MGNGGHERRIEMITAYERNGDLPPLEGLM